MPINLPKHLYKYPTPNPSLLSFSTLSIPLSLFTHFQLSSEFSLFLQFFKRAQVRLVQELANFTGNQSDTVHESDDSDSDGITEPPKEPKDSVTELYKALKNRDVNSVHGLLNPDLEWWFHGPPEHQHMMRVLTGAAPDDTFVFDPKNNIEAFGPIVLVEGSDPTSSVYWIHAWTVGSDGIINQVREYFNTDLTVTKLGNSVSQVQGGKASASAHYICSPVWRSRILDPTRKSLPGLVLAL